MVALIGFFVLLTGGLFAFAWAMGPVVDGWERQRLATRDECEAIRRRLRRRARGIELDA
jgi:hypothetical protein